MHNPTTLYLLTGSNIQPREDYLKQAVDFVQERVGEIINTSSIYESDPWGFEDDVSFLNQVLIVETELPALSVLERVLAIEQEMGRSRKGNTYTSRTIDIDILYFGEDVINHDQLIVPHPRLSKRRFTVMPLNEIAPSFIHPILKISNQDLLLQCDDESKVKKLQND